MQGAQSEVVHWHPDRSFPVVFTLTEELVRGGKRPDTEIGPQVLRVLDEVKNGLEMCGGWFKEAEQEGEEGDVSFVADVD